VHTKTLKQISDGLARKDFSSIEITRHFLDRIAQHSDLNAFITLDGERAHDQARAADQLRANGDAGPLCGVPLAHKDIFCTQGVLTTCGSRMLSNFVSPYDATVVSKLADAGIVTLGKTNMDEFAMGSSNETSFFGPVRNPWDLNTVPGGSSGGSAAAVAARLVPAATGTDTGGSIRQPAALCGITGIKPTYGRVSRYGMIAFASSLDQAGPMTLTAADAALLLSAMAGFDPLDSTSVADPVPDYFADLSQEVKGLRIGRPIQYFGEGLDPEVARAVDEALRLYSSCGAKIVDVDLPNSDLCIPCYYVLAPSEASSNLSRFDGVRYGYRSEHYSDLIDMYMRTRAEGFGAEVKRRIMIGTYALSAGYYDAYYLQALKLRRLIANDFTQAFEKCDVIMGPTTPGTAFSLGSKTDDPISMYLNDIYTSAVNLAGLPAISIPCGQDTSGKPIGLQIIGNYFAEQQLLNTAHRYQSETEWHCNIPEDFR